MTTEDVRICAKCGVENPITEYAVMHNRGGRRSGTCRRCKNAASRAANAANPERKSASDRRYREQNKEKLAASGKAYREANLDTIRVKKKAYREENIEAERARGRATRSANLDSEKARFATWYEINSQRVIETAAKWKQDNPEARRAISARYNKKRRSTEQGRLESNISRGVHRGLRPGAKGNTPTFILLGFTPIQLKEHLEAQFTDGMTWDNYGNWHVDHVVPLSSHVYETPQDDGFKAAWALSNLQPLWAADNMSKGARLDWTQPIAANDNTTQEAKAS